MLLYTANGTESHRNTQNINIQPQAHQTHENIFSQKNVSDISKIYSLQINQVQQQSACFADLHGPPQAGLNFYFICIYCDIYQYISFFVFTLIYLFKDYFLYIHIDLSIYGLRTHLCDYVFAKILLNRGGLIHIGASQSGKRWRSSSQGVRKRYS